MNECHEVLFNYLVHHLHLPICLRVVRGTHVEGRAVELKQFLPETTDKQGILIGYEASWGAMNFARDLHE